MHSSIPLSTTTRNSMTISENYLCAVTSATKTRGNSLPPYHISEFMARATLEESLIKEKAEKDDILMAQYFFVIHKSFFITFPPLNYFTISMIIPLIQTIA